MTDVTSTVLPGPAVTIGAGIPNGFTIRNQSTTTAVWISGNPGVTPGNGMKLSALGSLTWNGGPCYAVLDTTTGSATLSLSNTTTSITDPVAVAQAVNALGVPSVFQGAQLPQPGNGEWDTSGYASLSLNVNFTGHGTLKLVFYPPNSGNPIYSESFTIGEGASGIEIVTNVYGPVMEIQVVGGNLATTAIIVYGSNRQIARDKCIADVLALNASANQAFASNTRYLLQSVTTPGGLAYFNFRASPALITGSGVASTWGFEYFDYEQNSLQFMVVANSKMFTQDGQGNWGWFGSFILPPGIIAFEVSNDGVATPSGTIAIMTGTLPN